MQRISVVAVNESVRAVHRPPTINALVPRSSTWFAVACDPAEQRSGERKIDNVMSIAAEIEHDIVTYLGAHYSVEPDEISDESTLEDLGLDSLGVLAIADIVEKKYGVSLDDERIAGVRTLSDFKDLVLLKIAEMA